MLYSLFTWLDGFDFPGAGLFHYISFRSAMALITALIVSTLIGKRVINYLRIKQVGETVRDLGLDGQNQKAGTPTMGGIIILAALIIPTLLFAKLNNIYVILMLLTTIWLGGIGFLDDYIKVFKKNKEGLAARFKLTGQVLLGIIVGVTIFFQEDIVIGEKIPIAAGEQIVTDSIIPPGPENPTTYKYVESKPTTTTIPFVKNNEFDYQWLVSWMGKGAARWTWLVFVVVIILIVTSVSNGANITDGLDGLATGVSAIIGATLGILAYVSGHYEIADYLNIMYIPNSGELTVFVSAFIGATVGFMWYNSYPAQVFMGDTGSLALGGIIAVFAVLIRKELLVPILCGIFLVENLSVLIQVGWFKYTRKRFGAGRRVFLMAPLHHHYQKKGYAEPKIVTRFLIVALLLAVISVVTLKIR
ncbi:MAG: phospho-N-acetylmuramoyl-pentapeptide-transferase [Bacteroidales bacterium]|jgi:phospho-N-acetylmuramoyl-pentapeptide-transferase|nr:phospho-N-acetylmuramoyl-pentapeptide-transferase [Bacteroidales bacterium]MDD2569578.1 phospho-N-acetylmuramoyl-pentapeptide-transferase [Bacteroidales bacterium]MDD2812874.1 phospho-N-acetylmuramoyl-pentapeptide-transferase [Bacteroidales bacterium]MDD3385677.1 phospho-N-acetylmuramoyl-pentapeptide-transferase [Bacteroidales bacterium]MDD3812082.1 phospho-N-acetylmuramoyl-pentapeptide-transferase [Bacteroidales bacterium]